METSLINTKANMANETDIGYFDIAELLFYYVTVILNSILLGNVESQFDLCCLHFQIPNTEDVSITTFYFKGPASNHGAYISTLPLDVWVFDVNRNFTRVQSEIKEVTQYITVIQEQG
jgi:hypothetical protein